MTDALDTAAQHAPISWRRRLCARLGGWCDYLLDTHHARIPF
jgi:hypothetical protein